MTVIGLDIGRTQAAIVVIAIVLIVIMMFVASKLLKRVPRKLNTQYFQNRWQEAQGLCANQNTWPLAIINADKLLDDALKRRNYKGKTMGERLVSAQHDIKENEGVWFAHKLRNKLVHEDFTKLKKKDVMQALLGIRAALKDMGALE